MNTKTRLAACLLTACSLNVQAALVAYWPLNEGAGQIAGDASGHGHDGILGDTTSKEQSDPAWVTDADRGKVLQLSGDQAPQWVNLTSHVGRFSGLKEGTLTAWVKMPGGDVQDIILCASDSRDGSSEIRFTYERGTLQFDVRDDSSNPAGETGNISARGVDDDKWHFVAVAVDSDSNANLYIDGRLVASGRQPFFSSVKDLNHMSLGRNIDSGGSQWAFKGRMSDVAVFDEPLRADTIKAIYQGMPIADVDKIASGPTPADGHTHLLAKTDLSWKSGATTPRYTVYFGTDPEFPSGPVKTGWTKNSCPVPMKAATSYYWRVDVSEGRTVYRGKVWSFTTAGKASDPFPAQDEAEAYTHATLSWTGDSTIASYDVYLAEKGKPLAFKGNTKDAKFPLDELAEFTTHNWRVDTRNAKGNVITAGDIWRFTTHATGAFFEETDLFVAGEDGYACYRIPSIIKAPNGDLLAFCEGRLHSCSDYGDIDLVMKRSTDNGKTWGPMKVVFEDGKYAIANPCPVVDESNDRLWMVFNRNYYDPDYKVFTSYSDDNGHTWSPREEVTSHVSSKDWPRYGTSPCTGIQLKSKKYRGRIVIPSYHIIGGVGREHGDHMMYSDDHGVTWKMSERIGVPSFDECQVVELIDGALMVNSRTIHVDPDHRGVAISKDGGETWSNVRYDKALPEPTCQGSILRYTRSDTEDKNRILFSNPAHTSKRVNGTVRLSYDEGKTWAVSKQLHAGPSAYSCLVVTSDWNIGCLYEKGKKDPYEKITFARFSLEWLTDGDDSIDKTKLSNGK